MEIGSRTIDLKGEWRYMVGAVSGPMPELTFLRNKPLGLFKGMISPLLNYTVKGVLWYQGESNTKNPDGYGERLAALISDWRKKWGLGDFPFIYVQLPNYMEAQEQPSESSWAAIREEQLKTLAVPNTAMAVAIDAGEWNDVHPLRKNEVGERLALAARRLAYSDDGVVYSGPIQTNSLMGGMDFEQSYFG